VFNVVNDVSIPEVKHSRDPVSKIAMRKFMSTPYFSILGLDLGDRPTRWHPPKLYLQKEVLVKKRTHSQPVFSKKKSLTRRQECETCVLHSTVWEWRRWTRAKTTSIVKRRPCLLRVPLTQNQNIVYTPLVWNENFFGLGHKPRRLPV
jgi:hypothetical protein